MDHNDYVLETEHLCKNFNGFSAVSGVILTVRRGHIHALIPLVPDLRRVCVMSTLTMQDL